MLELLSRFNVWKAMVNDDNEFIQFIVWIMAIIVGAISFPAVLGMGIDGYKVWALMTFWLLVFTYNVNKKGM